MVKFFDKAHRVFQLLDIFEGELRILDMQPTQFVDAIQAIIVKDTRYDVGAYYFLKDALDYSVKKAMDESEDGEHRHVSAGELIYGFRDLALQEFGPMASTLMKEWGLKTCSDIGVMVFQLIEEGVFGKQDSDTPEDFSNIFNLMETLENPYLPKKLESTLEAHL